MNDNHYTLHTFPRAAITLSHHTLLMIGTAHIVCMLIYSSLRCVNDNTVVYSVVNLSCSLHTIFGGCLGIHRAECVFLLTSVTWHAWITSTALHWLQVAEWGPTFMPIHSYEPPACITLAPYTVYNNNTFSHVSCSMYMHLCGLGIILQIYLTS